MTLPAAVVAMARRPRRLLGATVQLAAVVVGSGLIACGPPVALQPDRVTQAPVPAEVVPPAPAMAEAVVAKSSAQGSTYLVLRLKERRLYLMSDDVPAPLASFPIAIGRKGRETPIGRFEVEEMVEHPHYDRIDPNDRSRVLKRVPPGPENPLGVRWIGFAHGDAWTLGIHGTPKPELLGQAVSGGCVRMRNADVIRVYESVELGTTVIVYP
jgi:lipoprotein-anchoring transpeptidase ErfK/SrfK